MINDIEARARRTALQVAAGLVCGVSQDGRVSNILDVAEMFTSWLLGTVSLSIIRGPVVDQTTDAPTGTTNSGDPMQLHDTEKFALTVDTKDSKGFETSDAVTWASDDGGAVVALAVAADGRSCEVAAVAPGSAVITVTDASVTPALSVTEAVDVVPSGTATIGLAEGVAEPQ